MTLITVLLSPEIELFYLYFAVLRARMSLIQESSSKEMFVTRR